VRIGQQPIIGPAHEHIADIAGDDARHGLNACPVAALG
jgi:hypothetical protein